MSTFVFKMTKLEIKKYPKKGERWIMVKSIEDILRINPKEFEDFTGISLEEFKKLQNTLKEYPEQIIAYKKLVAKLIVILEKRAQRQAQYFLELQKASQAVPEAEKIKLQQTLAYQVELIRHLENFLMRIAQSWADYERVVYGKPSKRWRKLIAALSSVDGKISKWTKKFIKASLGKHLGKERTRQFIASLNNYTERVSLTLDDKIEALTKGVQTRLKTLGLDEETIQKTYKEEQLDKELEMICEILLYKDDKGKES